MIKAFIPLIIIVTAIVSFLVMDVEKMTDGVAFLFGVWILVLIGSFLLFLIRKFIGFIQGNKRTSYVNRKRYLRKRNRYASSGDSGDSGFFWFDSGSDSDCGSDSGGDGGDCGGGGGD